MTDQPTAGSITWHDLTVPDAESVRDFYQSVVGWKPSAVDMGGYSDFSMLDADGNTASGICHARGINADLPPQWLLYITVADMDASLAACRDAGGTVLHGPRDNHGSQIAVIQDPAGAVCALYQPSAG